jgi:hypothetical protein
LIRLFLLNSLRLSKEPAGGQRVQYSLPISILPGIWLWRAFDCWVDFQHTFSAWRLFSIENKFRIHLCAVEKKTTIWTRRWFSPSENPRFALCESWPVSLEQGTAARNGRNPFTRWRVGRPACASTFEIRGHDHAHFAGFGTLQEQTSAARIKRDAISEDRDGLGRAISHFPKGRVVPSVPGWYFCDESPKTIAKSANRQSNLRIDRAFRSKGIGLVQTLSTHLLWIVVASWATNEMTLRLDSCRIILFWHSHIWIVKIDFWMPRMK